MRHGRAVRMLVLGLLVPASMARAQPAIEVCADPALVLTPGETATTTIEIEDATINSIGFSEIAVDLSHTWAAA